MDLYAAGNFGASPNTVTSKSGMEKSMRVAESLLRRMEEHIWSGNNRYGDMSPDAISYIIVIKAWM